MCPVIFKDSVEPLISKASQYLSADDLDRIRRAYEFASNGNRWVGLTRFSGEPAIVHSLAVAEKLADWRMDAATIAAGILHDTIEDTNIRILQLRATFKDKVAFLVDAVTKLKKFELAADTDAHTAYFHKMFLALAADIRVSLIKLADRLHNMRTLEYLPAEKQRNTSIETRAVFIPLARFLGIESVRSEMEDITFQFLEPREFEKTRARAETLIPEEDAFFERVAARLHDVFAHEGLHAVWRRVIWNLGAMRAEFDNADNGRKKTGLLQVSVPLERDCYMALWLIHSQFNSTNNHFVDTIRVPDVNLKRWLETELIDPDDRGAFCVRIVSEEMARVNEMGIVSLLAPAAALSRTDFLQARIEEIHGLIEDARKQRGPRDEHVLVEMMIKDLLQNEIIVSTPDSKQVSMPRPSTVLDLAYKLGQSLGDHFSHAFVNNQLVPIGYELKSCDHVRIVTNVKVSPELEWLQYAHTPKTRYRVKHFLSHQPPELAQTTGRRVLVHELRRVGIIHAGGEAELDALLHPLMEFMGLPSAEAFYTGIGYGEITVAEAMDALKEQKRRSVLISEQERAAALTQHPVFKRTYTGAIVRAERPVESAVALCWHCTPLPGDIVELAGAGKKALLHRVDCRRTGWRRKLGKRVRVEWGEVESILFPVRMMVKKFPSEETHRETLRLVAARGGRVVASLRGETPEKGLETMELIMEMPGLEALEALRADLLQLKDIVAATRI